MIRNVAVSLSFPSPSPSSYTYGGYILLCFLLESLPRSHCVPARAAELDVRSLSLKKGGG